jgi:uncharacterized membrane protein
LPIWLSIVVVLVLLGNFSWNTFVVGPEAYASNVIIGGLLGAYAGVDQLVRRRREQAQQQAPPSSGAGSPKGGDVP